MLHHYLACGYSVWDAEDMAHRAAEEQREAHEYEALPTW